MKENLRIGFLIGFFLVLSFQSKASHVLGSELYFKFTDAFNLQLNLRIYRDCSECKFNGNGGGVNSDNCSEIPPIEVYGVDNITGKKVYLTSVSITRTGIQNITNTCVGLTNACDITASPDFVRGMEVHNFIAGFNTQTYESQGYCHFYFVTSIFSRSDEITPPGSPIEKFFNYSELNFCSGIKSGTVNLSNEPNFMVSVGSPIYHSPGINQGDADSISVKLVPALSAFGQEISYISGYSFKLPLMVLGCGSIGCQAEPSAEPPTGFYFDENTGNTIFTPQLTGQVGTLVYEITKWKKDASNQFYAVSKMRRDYLIKTYSNANTEPKIDYSPSIFKLCTETKFSLNVSIKDGQNISLSMSNLIAGMSFSQTSHTAPTYNLLFTWTPPSDAAGKIYFITVKAQDEHCPINAISTKTFILKVAKTPSLSISLDQKACGNIELKAMPSTYPDNMYLWRVTYPNTVTKEYWGKTQKIQHLSGGTLNLELGLNQVCKGTTVSSISLPTYTIPKFSLDSEYISCLGTNITVTPTGILGNSPFKYYWNDSLGSSFLVLSAGKDYPLTVKIEDVDGCTNKVSTVIKSYPILKPITRDSSFCAYDSGRFVINELLENSYSTVSNGFELLGGGTQLFNDNGEWYFMKQNFSKEFITFRAWIQDEHACKYYDTFRIYKTSGLKFSQLKIGTFCMSEKKVNLIDLLDLKENDGIFESIVYGAIENNNILNLSAFTHPGTYDIYFISSPKYCSKVTTLQIEIVASPDISWISNLNDKVCKNSDVVSLGGEGQGGTWTGVGVTENIFNPQVPEVVAGQDYQLIYYVQEPILGCSSTDTLLIHVYDAPSFDLIFTDSAKNPITKEACINQYVAIEVNSLSNSQNYPPNFRYNIEVSKGVLHPNFRLLPDSLGGVHRVSLVTESDLCPDVFDYDSINFERLPSIYVNTSETEFCENDKDITIEYFSENTNTIDWYLNWLKVGESNNSKGVFQVKDIKSGSYIFSAKLSNNVCKNEVELINPIVINPVPEPIIYVTPTQYVPVDMRFVSISDKGNYLSQKIERTWTIEGVVYENVSSLTHRIQTESGEIPINLFVKNEFGCSAETKSLLYISPPLDLYIPNAFSPDGVGPESNNTFKVNTEHVKDFNMVIYNKWGAVVFHTTDPTKGWDGTFLGAELPSDVFIYYIKVVNQLGGTREFRGTVTLLR